MRIMFVTGASSVHSERWVSFFAEKGHEVFWVSLGEPPMREYENLRFVEIPKHALRPLRPLAYVRALKRLIRWVGPDVLHAHQVWIDAIVAAATGFQPLVVTPWGSDVLLGPRSRLKRPLIAMALKRAELITCDGENTAVAVEDLGVGRKKIKIVCFGTNVDHFTPDRSGVEVRSRLAAGNGPVVLSLRSHRPLYDVGMVVRAAAVVLRECPDAVFVVAGDGVQRQDLMELAETLGVSRAMRFVGQVPEADLPAFLNAANVYVSTALSDSGLAASTAEAMACGLPVVVTDTGSNRDWIKDGENGYVIPVKSPQVLAQRILDLIHNPERREVWGRLNRAIIVERNNYTREMTVMERLYANVSRPPFL